MTTAYTCSPETMEFIALGQETIRRAMAEETREELVAWLQGQLQRLAGSGNEKARILWEESFAYYDALMAKREAEADLPEEQRKVLTWPWASWSNLIDPFEPGLLGVLAAGDGAGKTLYAECIAEHWASRGRRVAFLHFELNPAIMFDRRAVRHSGVPRRTLKLGKLTPEEKRERAAADDRMRAWTGGITYVHCPGWTAEKTLGELRGMISEELCDVVILDYLEKIGASARQIKLYGTQLYEREADDVEQIKSFSEMAETPALLLSQLNKMGKRQEFADLDRTAIRGSGGKTEKANIVILLHRESAESEMVQVRVDKNTLGPTGSFTQYMDTARFRVTDLAR